MVQGDNLNFTVRSLRFKNFAMQFIYWRQLLANAKSLHNIGHGKSSQSGNYFWLDNGNLPIQKRPIDAYFLRQRIPVKRRSVFNDIGNINLFSFNFR